MEHILKVLSYHGQIDAQISTNSGQIRPTDPQEHKEKLQVPCYSKFSRNRNQAKLRISGPGPGWSGRTAHVSDYAGGLSGRTTYL